MWCGRPTCPAESISLIRVGIPFTWTKPGSQAEMAFTAGSSIWELLGGALSLTGEDVERRLSVVAVVAVEDVADDHAGLPHSSISHQHAAQLFPQSASLFTSLAGLCHLNGLFI